MNSECKNKCWHGSDHQGDGNYCTEENEYGPDNCPLFSPIYKVAKDMVNHPSHYAGKIEVIDYIRDKLTPEGFTEYCCGNVLKYISRWRKKDGIQDLKKAQVYLGWMIESAEKEASKEVSEHE